MIPKTIKILGHSYKVKVEAEEKNGNDNLGTHWRRYDRIYLNKEQAAQSMESCFLHEIIEALNAWLQIGLKHPQINQLETGLYQVIKDNKNWKVE